MKMGFSKSSSLSVLSVLAGFYVRKDFLAGTLRRAHCEPERVVGSVLGFLCCVGAKILPHFVASNPLFFDITLNSGRTSS